MHTIPQEYGTFDRPTAIAVVDNTRAKLFLANGSQVESLDEIASHYPPEDDIERSSGQSPSGVHFAEQHETDKMVSRDRVFELVSKKLLSLLIEKRFEVLVVCAPEEHLEELKETLHANLLKRTVAFVPKLLTSEDWLDIVLHVKEVMWKI